MKLYDSNISGNSYKVRLLLARLQIPCDIVPVDILRGESRTAEFLALNPNGRAPLLGDDGFVERCRRRVTEDVRLNHPDVTEGRRLSALEVEEVIAAACDVFGCSRHELLHSRRGAPNTLRGVTIMVCRDLTPATGRALGAAFGVHPATISWTAPDPAVFGQNTRK